MPEGPWGRNPPESLTFPRSAHIAVAAAARTRHDPAHASPIIASPMLLIPCPWCGRRDETEFRYGGEAHIVRPESPDALDDAAWADYLFMRSNPKGWFRERWLHVHGCRRWFNVVRHTVTHEIAGSYRIGEESPPFPQP